MKLFHILSQRSKDITSLIFLSLSYVVGVGFTSTVGKLIGQHFLDLSPEKSTWVAHPTDSSWEHMY